MRALGFPFYRLIARLCGSAKPAGYGESDKNDNNIYFLKNVLEHWKLVIFCSN